MRFTGFVVKTAGVLVVLMGLVALAVVAAPYVYGQSTVRRAPMTELRTQMLGGSYIGVTVRDADSADAERAKLPQATGAVIEEVRGESPASTAGLRAGDVITRFDGERVRSARHFERLVAETPDGRQVEMTVARAGETVNTKVTPEAAPSLMALDSLRGLRGFDLHAIPELRDLELRMPESFTVTVPRIDADGLPRLMTMRGRLGVGVQDMTDQLGEYFGAAEGVLVTSVEDETPAKTAGLRAGDVITKIDGEPVRTAGELRRRLDRASGEVALTIVRERREQVVKVEISERDRQAVRRIVR